VKIKRLHLQNFRVHGNSVLNIGDSAFVVIKGKNFAGKSTIGQGLSMCLTPSTAGLDPQGREYSAKIKRGESKAVITADIQTKFHLVQRVTTLNTNSSGRTRHTICLSDPDWNPAQFDRKLDQHRAALTVCLNTDAFFRMDEKEQKNLLAGLALPARYDFDKTITEAVDKVLGPGTINFEGEPFAAINQAYKKLFDERQIVNRDVRDFSMPQELPVPAGVDSLWLQDRLAALRVERREKQQSRDAAVAEASAAEAERARAQGRIDAMEAVIAKEQHRAQSIRAFLVPDDRLAYLKKVAEGRGELDRLAKEKADKEKLIDDHMRQLGRLDNIAEAGKTCPTCDQSIDQQKLVAACAKLHADLKAIRDEHNLIYQKIKALGEVAEAVEEIARNHERLKELAAIDATVDEKANQLADEPQPEPVLFDFAPYDRGVADIDTEIETLSDQLRPVIAAEERRKEIAIRQEQLSRLKNKAATLDKLVKHFDKDGIKAKLLGQYIGGFENKINEVLGAWGYSAVLSIEPYSFDITNARGDVIPARELSGAERIMFSLAFQCAVSRTAEIGLVVIDEVSTFLPELRPVLYRRCYEMLQSGYLEQVILLVADNSPTVPALAGSVFFLVNDGVVTRLERNGGYIPSDVGESNVGAVARAG
jgi:DNA repair exonuclease SbcCD ATPase subunit